MLRSIIRFLLEDYEYRGEHGAPDKESGSPLYDLTLNGTYPEDIYSANGPRYYGEGSPRDSVVFGLVYRCHNRPNRRIKIYRSVPYESTVEEQIWDLEKDKKYMLKYGKVPRHISSFLSVNTYWGIIDDKLEKLVQEKDKPRPKLKINPGDWVTIDRSYAVSHGKGALNGQYKILSKTVRASEVYTNGDSLFEWGWDP